MITLAHLSDIHLAPLPPVRATDLLNKRITGFINWKIKRETTLDGEGLTRLVHHMQSQTPDFIAVTGDLVNLALDAEIDSAYNWLQTVGPPERVCVSPGNHDAYIPGQLEKALDRWNGYVLGETVDDNMFPFVRRVGEVAIISCNSAIPTPPWFAAGRFDDDQQQRLTRCLRLLGDAGFFRVVMIHHPPAQEIGSHPRYGLWGAKKFRQAVAEAGAELILHGHTHKSTIHAIPGPDSDVPVVGVAAAGTAQADTAHDPARYNLFKIERVGNGWQCTLKEYGFQRLHHDIVQRLSVRIY